MKKIIMLASIFIFSALTVVLAQPSAQDKKEKTAEPVKVFWTGDRGQFEYTWSGEDTFVVWRVDEKGGKTGLVFGRIDYNTKIIFKNRKGLTRQNLDLLSGKEVSVIAQIKRVGQGEGSEDFCKELEIVVQEGN